jgi:ankyrin repeat protein
MVVGLMAWLALLSAGCGNDIEPGEQSRRNRELIAAAWDDDVELARELIGEGADVNYQDATRQSAYLIATSEGQLELLELTLANGADVTALDSFNGTGLIRAAERGHAEVVERLLDTDIEVNHVNNLGWTALHEAIILGDGSERYVRTVQLLLDHGADPTLATGDGQAPLALAQSHQQPAIAELIRGALPDPS